MKKILRCLALIAALCVGWVANAQELDVYTFSTGIDSTKWIALTDYTNVSGTGSGDGWPSSVMNIGFSFPFGDNVYTQYSVNSDGNLRLGSTVTGTSNYGTPFSSSAANTNNPKINFFGCDGFLVSGTHYIHSQNFGDTLLVVEYCLGPYSSTYRNNQFLWQVHLYSNGKVEAVFADNSNLNSSNAHYMGMCINSSDCWIVNSSSVACFITGGTTTADSWPSTTWPTPYTYFTFEKPVTNCPRPSQITVTDVTATTASITFTPTGTETTWIGTITDGNSSFTVTLSDTVMQMPPALLPNTEYTVRVRALCGVGDTSTARTTTFHTECMPMTLADLPYTEDFESYGTGSAYPIGFCWTKGTNGTTAYPYPYSSAAINGTRGLYFYGYKPSSASSTRIYSYAALPELASSVDVSGLTLRFNAKRYATTTTYYRTVLLVGVMTDPTDITTFDTVETYNLTPLPASTVVNVECDLNNYAGNGKYVAFYVPYVDTNTSNTYNYVYLDDVELLVTPTCRRPTSLTISDITSSSATVSWTPYSNDQTTFAVAYGTGTNPDSMTTVVVTGTSLTMSALSEATQYNVYVKAVCSSTDESEWSIPTSFFTMQVPVAVTTSNFFKDDFEGGENWLLFNDANNKWFIGNVTNNGGERSLYISNNSGVSYAYGTNTTQWSYAQKALTLGEGQYVVSFDWKAYGQNNYDFLRAFLVPSSVMLSGGMSANGSTPYSFRNVTPTGWIALDGGAQLNMHSTWQSQIDTATITTPGVYNLVFLWTNDGSGGTQPPAAVDNVKVVYKPANSARVVLTNADPTMGYTIPEPDNYYFAVGDTMRATALPYYGYQFEYWELDAGLVRDSITINPIAQVVPAYMANMSFNAIAHFTPMTYTLSVVSNNTLLGSVTGSGSYTYLDTATLTATPNAGFRFLHWNDGDTNATRTVVVTRDSAFTAIFDYQPVTVTLSVANPSMGTTVPAPGTYTFSVGDTMRATAIPNQYHRFVSWTLSAMGLSESVTMNPVSEVVPLFLAGMNFNITCNFEEYHLPAFDSIYDFENAAADSVWTLNNGTVTNQWVIDSAISNGGSRSLYISNDGGTSNAYTNNSVSFAYAELGGWMEPGIYNISYDWKANGEGNYDYLRVFLAPIDYVFTAGQTPIGTTSSNGFLNMVPEGLIPLDGATKKNLSTSFNTFTATGVPIATRGEYKIVFMWANDLSGGSQPPAAIDNIMVEMPPCPAPASLTVTDITASSAVLSWFSTPDVTNFVVEYGYDTTAATMASVTGNTTTITGLIDNTTYYFRVGYSCDDNTNAMSEWVPFTTLCSAIDPSTLPYTENFDSYTTTTTSATGIEPDCWTLAHRDVTISSNTYLPQIYYGSSNAHSGNYSLRLYYRCIYAMPAIDTNISALQMGFWVKQTSTNYRLIVGVMSDLEDETTFVPVDTIINSSTSASEYHEVLFSNYTGNGHYIAFRNFTPASYNYSYNYIDDINVDFIPTCPAPTNVTAELINDSTVTVTWTPFDNTQNNFEVAYGTGNNPDSMMFAYSSTNSVTITGLTAETNYNFYVLAICSPTDVSPWSIPASAYIGYCQPAPTSIDNQGITNVTFGTGDEVVNNSQRPTSAPYYGNYYNQVGAAQVGDSVNVAITYATGYTYGTIIWVDWNNNLTFDGNEVVYVGTAPNNNPTTLNASFEVPATQEAGIYRMRIAGADSYYDSYTSSIEAAANANPCPTSTYTIVHDYSLHVFAGSSTDCATTCQISIVGVDSYGDSWNGGSIVISQNGNVLDTFTVESGVSDSTTVSVCNDYPVEFNWLIGSYDSEVSFTIYDGSGALQYTCTNGSNLPDSVFYAMNNPCPSCFMPVVTVDSINTNSVSISWTDDNSGATYTIYNGSTIEATGITTNSYTFTGLTDNSDYTFGVQANCSATDASSISTVTIHTPAEAITCNGGPALVFANADNGTTTSSYFPGYSLYNYSYSEVIIPAERLTGLGEIKGMEFKPTSVAAGSSHFTNCEIYMLNTAATTLSNGFIQDTANFQLVFTGDLSYSDTTWQTVTFDNSFTWNGSDNLLIAVRRNDGSWASSGSFQAYTADAQLARYVYRDASSYPIGEITGGTATTNVPVYHLLGCGATCQITIEGEDDYGDGWNGGYIVVSQSGSALDTFTVDGTYATTTIEVSGDAPVQFSWNVGSWDSEVSFTIYDGSNSVAFYCADGSNLTTPVFFTMNTPCPHCLAPTITVDNFTNNSATISWTDNNSGATYTIYDDTTVVATGVSTNSYTFTGLTGHTAYSFGVQANCSANDASNITYTAFTTLSDPIMCDNDTAMSFANADSATNTTQYYPGYSYYNYSYTEVIIPAERLTGLGEIKGMEFKPTSVANGSSYFTNCEIYLMNTNATSLANGFIQDTNNLQLVFSGDLSYDNTNWQLVTFDTSFTRNGNSNLLVAVRRNHGDYSTSGYFESFTSTDTLARYVYRDASAYPIGEITGGTATTNVPVYHLIGCEAQIPAGVTANIAVNDTAMGTTVPAPGTYTINLGDTIGAYAVANTGYHFDYWTVSVLGLTDTITTNPIADVVPAYLAGVTFDITANFALNMYTITAAANDATMGTVTGSGSYAYGTTATLTATPATGYHFVQWNDADTHATRTITVTSNATYTATFAPDTYTITVVSNNTLLGTVTGGGTYTYGTTATLTATAATNCHFVQWNDANTSASRTVTVTGDATYTATFAYNPVTVTLTINDTNMGTTNPAPGTYTFNVGDTINATALPATGYHFNQWVLNAGLLSDSTSDNPVSFVVPAVMAGMSIGATAQFDINIYNITVAANDNARGSVTGSGSYPYGTEVTITATPALHNYLLQWSDGDTNLTRTITVTHDATYTALFHAYPQHTVTLNATTGGTVTGTGVYYEDDMVTITATPDEYFEFVNWVDINNNVVYTEPNVTFEMGTSNIVLTAVFNQVVFEATLDVTINNSEWGYVLINGERSDRYQGHTGDTITLEAVANDGFHFDYWQGVHSENDTSAIVTIILAEPATDVLCFFAENVGIRDVVEDNTIIYTKNNNIVVSGAEQQTIRVFDVVGRLVAQRSNAAIEETIPMPATGVYLVQVGNRPARRVVVRK